MPRRTDWVALAERALDRMLAARTQRTAAKWQREYDRAVRGGARQERRDAERAQKDAGEYDDFDYYGHDDYWEIEVAFDY
jgi:hypothetical protein